MQRVRKFRHKSHKDEEECFPASRIAIFGDAKVGKSELLQRLFFDEKEADKRKRKETFSFRNPYIPTVEEYYEFIFHHGNCTVALQIVDTCGTEQFPAMRKLNIMRSDLVVIMYDVKRKSSMKEAIRLYNFTRDVKPPDSGQMVIFVGGKSDLLSDQENYHQHI